MEYEADLQVPAALPTSLERILLLHLVPPLWIVTKLA
jgi:hypothetical protein